MDSKASDIIICGAGIAGVATAWYLSTHYGLENIVLVDRQQPLSYTSSKSGENFRDYWPQACMSGFIGRSIDLMEFLSEDSGDAFDMRHFGYQFVSTHRQREIFPSQHLRQPALSGALEQITDQGMIRSHFPYLSDTVKQIVHIHRAGAVDAYAMGMLMLQHARDAGVTFKTAQITRISKPGSDFVLETGQGDTLFSRQLVLAAGPMNRGLAAMLGVKLNIQSCLQRKFVIPDPQQIIPRDMPFTIFADPQFLDWSDEEREMIGGDEEYRWLLDEFPAGLHIKPESKHQIKLGWAFNREPEDPLWEPDDDFDFPNIALRGASKFIPGLRAYLDQLPTPVVQYSGYYTRTPENWPVIGPLKEHTGLYTVAALSGYGTMAACAAGELVANWMMGESLPDYARHFARDRYDDPGIVAEINAIESDGQL
jgi:glycine/D-amino acid oxidase-like deaminating enzyme